MPDPLIVTVILNTNRKDDTLECLHSLAANDYPRHHVIVLDNHSTDGSVPAIKAAFPEVEIIALQENRGYAGNNNVGVQAAIERGADWVFVLNEDTVVAPDCLPELVKVGEGDPQIGVVGPLVYHHDEPQVIQSAGGSLGPYWISAHLGQNETDQGQFNQVRKVAWISGCAILVRRSAIEQVGALDERFFYYWEETEWCMRIREAGWGIFNVPTAKIWHKGVTRNYQPKPSLAYYNTRNRLLLLNKHQAPLAVQAVAWAQILRTLISLSIRPKWRSKRAHRDAMQRGLVDCLRGRWGQMPA